MAIFVGRGHAPVNGVTHLILLGLNGLGIPGAPPSSGSGSGRFPLKARSVNITARTVNIRPRRLP